MSREKRGEGLSCIPKRLFNAFYNDVVESNLPMFNVISLVRQDHPKFNAFREIRTPELAILSSMLHC